MSGEVNPRKRRNLNPAAKSRRKKELEEQRLQKEATLRKSNSYSDEEDEVFQRKWKDIQDMNHGKVRPWIVENANNNGSKPCGACSKLICTLAFFLLVLVSMIVFMNYSEFREGNSELTSLDALVAFAAYTGNESIDRLSNTIKAIMDDRDNGGNQDASLDSADYSDELNQWIQGCLCPMICFCNLC